MRIKLYLLFIVFSTSLWAQQKQVLTSIDTTKNKIGAEFVLAVKTTVEPTNKVQFPNLKNIGALEVIESYPIDTVKKDNLLELTKKYGLTQFDSGKYTIPAIKIVIDKKAFYTDSLKVEVADVAVDTLKQKMYDIKDIIKAENSWGNWWKYLLLCILLACLGAWAYWYFKVRKAPIKEEIVYKTPIEKATSLLNSLEQKELWQKGDVKGYYSELTDIARNYIEEAIAIPAMESTTSELIAGLKAASQKKNMKLSQETIENLERVLKQADLVKFAKSKPLDFEITEDRNKIQKTILTLDNAIPAEVETDEAFLLNEAQKQKQLQLQLEKERKAKIRLGIGIGVGLLTAIFAFFVITKGFWYTIDSILGHPSKELLEGDWIKSQYGNPGIRIETPQVLTRIDLKKSLPKDGLALIKDMQSFGYGNFKDNFYIMVSTYSFQQENALDLPKALDSTIKMLEHQGAQNMLVKQEDFETPEGLKGIKGYGTFSKIDEQSNSSSKLYYEVILFSQNGGLQQILFLHEEGDDYAMKIAERMMNSVELKLTRN